ncbi:MAG: phenylpyruvate tautomerase MIF-related protein [Lentisphaerae bacterium]|nr:phenylpyruvate tautomerase MIF-related protein [Lentisphaerota bacterium]
MPLIKMQTSVKCPDEQKKSLVLELSKICSHCTKKPESYVQAIIEDDAVISFGGKIANSAFIEVKGIGGLTSAVNKELSAAISKLLEVKLKISPSEVYINFTEVSACNWGCNGSTFG